MTSFEATNSLCFITDENKRFSISVTGHWRIPNYLEDGNIDKLKNLLKLRSQNDIELHVEEVRKSGDEVEIKSKQFSLSDSDTFKKKEILEGLKSAFYHNLEELVCRIEVTFDAVMIILDIKKLPS